MLRLYSIEFNPEFCFQFKVVGNIYIYIKYVLCELRTIKCLFICRGWGGEELKLKINYIKMILAVRLNHA